MTSGERASEDRVRDLLKAALELPTEGERREFLERECEDPELRARVETLLASDEAAVGFFGSLGGELGIRPAEEAEPAPDLSGRQVGAYRLIEPLGRGGMGVVYLAERTDGEFEHQVAVKLLAMGMIGTGARTRFLAERQILAGLEHPAIARLFDGGVTEDGTPYFVMERVDGERIDRWCDERKLPLEDRLRLTIEVCEAVEAAHRKLIVHRDLKPANILVADEGQPKLLDFGVAKVLAGAEDDLTQSRFAPLTPTWAAPEQVAGQPVTTATDTHALGGLLYLLIAGVPPYALEDSSPTGMLERLQADPVAPSRRFASLDADQQAEIAAARSTSPGALKRSLDGDLDAIVSRALAPEPERRYGRAGELAADLANHLEGRPVSARPPSAVYRLRKFVRRNRAAVAAALGFVALLSAALVAVTLEQRQTAEQRDRAEQEAARAERVTQFTLDLFDAANPESGEEASARDLLEAGLERIDEMADEPLAQADMLGVIGAAYTRLQQYDRVEEAARRELALRREHQDPSSPSIGVALGNLGQVLSIRGEIEEGERLMLEAIEHDETYFPGVDREESVWHLRKLTRHYERQGNLQEAERWGERGLAMARRLWGDDHLQVASFLSSQAFLAGGRHDWAEAQALYEESTAIRARHFGEDHPDIAGNLHNLGFIAMRAGDHAKAEDSFVRALELKRRLYDDDNATIAATLAAYGNLLVETGRFDDAEVMLRRSLEIKETAFGRVHAQSLPPLMYLAAVERERGNFSAAEEHLDEALEIAHETIGEHGSRQVGIWRGFAELREAEGRTDEAIAAYRNEITSLETTGDPDRRWIEPLRALARLTADTNPGEARSLLEQADALARQYLPVDDPAAAEIEAALAAI